jgi:hypothetical protein
MKYSKLFMFACIVAIAALALTASVGSLAAPAATCDVVVVTEDDVARQVEDTPPTKNWVLYTRAATPGTGTFVVGPGQPPLGVGSLQLQTVSGSDKVFLFNYDHIGTRLADINKMGYATYRTAGSADQLPSINIQVDYNGPDVAGGFTTLVFEPVYNLNQQAVVNNTWQTWDAYNGGQAIWWSTRAIPGVCARDCFVTWDAIVAANPNATILGGYGINQGSGNPGLNVNVDALSIGTGDDCVTYNFDPFRVATTKEDCKNGGYNNMKDAQGNSFKNQGQCIQYVNTGK